MSVKIRRNPTLLGLLFLSVTTVYLRILRTHPVIFQHQITAPTIMDIIRMYDYYFFNKPYRNIEKNCEYTLCRNSILCRRFKNVDLFNNGTDILEYMLYNASGDTGLPALYSCCTSFDGGHVCNNMPIMIGSKLEEKILKTLSNLLQLGESVESTLYDRDYLHKIYAGSFLVNGTFYYSVFRESNNNKICHNSKSKRFGNQTVAYFYDKVCNRGIKLYTNIDGDLMINGRDGNHIPKVTGDILYQIYKDCMDRPDFYSTDTDLVKGMFQDVKKEGVRNIDRFKNKMYTNYTIGLNTFLNKISAADLSNPMCINAIMGGKINLGISQRLKYPPSKSDAKKLNEQKLKMCTGQSNDYLIESQRRRNSGRKNADSIMEINEEIDYVTNVLGSRNVKSQSFIERMEQGEKAAPSIFNQISTSYLPHIKILSATVQKLQVENVHAESSKTISQDAFGFICMKYMGNIATAGKNMLFTDKVIISYGNVNLGIGSIEDYLSLNVSEGRNTWLFDYTVPMETGKEENVIYIVINNGLTRYGLYKSYVYSFLVKLKCECENFAWIKLVGKYLHIYFYEGMPFIKFSHDDLLFDTLKDLIDVKTAVLMVATDYLYFCRSELEFLCEAVLMLGYLKISGKHRLNSAYKYLIEDRGYNNDYVDRYRGRDNSYLTLSDGTIKLLNDARYGNMDEHRFIELVNLFVLYGVRSVDSASVVDGKLSVVDTTTTLSTPDVIGGQKNDNGSVISGCHDNDDDLVVVRLDDLIKRSSNREAFNCKSIQSLLATQVDQYTNFTAPAKRSVSVNARKSACINVYYQKAADLIRGFSIFVDPDGYEKRLALRLEESEGVPAERTLDEFRRMRFDSNNCPADQNSYEMKNFYMLKTVFADIAGFNVEDANVIDESVDLCMSFSYSFSLTFVDKTERGVNVCVNENARNSATVCQFDASGNPLAVMFLVCIISACSNGQNLIHFPPFRKLSILVDLEGNYYVYYIRNDAVLLRSIKRAKLEKSHRNGETQAADGNVHFARAEKFGGAEPYPYCYKCQKEDDVIDALKMLKTKIFSFVTDNGERIINIDVRVYGEVDKYDGVKIINSFGQKGLAVIKDLKPYFQRSNSLIPIQLIMNNCSFVSRQPIGQLLQMKNNMYETVYSARGEPAACGFSSVFFNEIEPTVTTCLVRLDEMMRSVLITLGLTSFQNVKSCTDNIYNPRGLMLSPQVRQIIALYRCMGVAYKINGDDQRYYAKRCEIQHLIDLFDEYASKIRRKIRVSNYTNQMTMLEIPQLLKNFRNVDYLQSQKRLSIHFEGAKNAKVYKINLLDENERKNTNVKRNHLVYKLKYYDESGCENNIVVQGNPCIIHLIIDECKLYDKYNIKDVFDFKTANDDPDFECISPVGSP